MEVSLSAVFFIAFAELHSFYAGALELPSTGEKFSAFLLFVAQLVKLRPCKTL